MAADFKNLTDLLCFEGPLLELGSREVSLVGHFVQHEGLIPKFFGRDQISFFRLTVMRDSCMRGQNAFFVAALGGETSGTLRVLNDLQGDAPPKSIIFDAERKGLLGEDPSQPIFFDDVINIILRKSEKLRRVFGARDVMLPANYLVRLPGQNQLTRFDIHGEVCGRGSLLDGKPQRPSRRSGHVVRPHLRLIPGGKTA